MVAACVRSRCSLLPCSYCWPRRHKRGCARPPPGPAGCLPWSCCKLPSPPARRWRATTTRQAAADVPFCRCALLTLAVNAPWGTARVHPRLTLLPMRAAAASGDLRRRIHEVCGAFQPPRLFCCGARCRMGASLPRTQQSVHVIGPLLDLIMCSAPRCPPLTWDPCARGRRCPRSCLSRTGSTTRGS